nr:histidinol dehydrogenase [Candidatus Gracilibacteria bacterium]
MLYIKGLTSNKDEFNEFNSSFTLNSLLARPAQSKEYVENVVSLIENDVLLYGDDAIKELTKKFDLVDLDNFLVSKNEFEEAIKEVDDKLKKAIGISKNNIEKFHKRQKVKNLEPEETSPGVFCWREFRAIESVGLYIPGGTASLFSSVLMLGIPANLAGCKDIQICTPVNKEGKISPEILYTANILGINKVYKIGGAQAIFAMAYGTKQVSKVDKIFGPGNAFVTEAKLKVSKFCSIDMPAGPSEVLIIADEFSNPKFIAADLISQAEHGKDSQCVLLSTSTQKIKEVLFECKNQLIDFPRQEIAIKALENSFAIFVDTLEQAIIISNQYAPEHLILQVKDWNIYLNNIINAGSVFCGSYSPESVGDYSSGTNHTLPTNGFAKSYSGIGLESFGKRITFQEVTKNGLQTLKNTVEDMSLKEGLFGHKNAVSIRFKNFS